MLERLRCWLQAASPAVPVAAVASATSVSSISLDTLADDPAVADPAAPQPASTDMPDIVIIDVRSEREFQSTAIDHAVNLPLPQLEQRIRELVTDTATPLFLYCASGARSGMACMMLRQLGYANVTNAGGLYAAAAQLQREIRR